MSLFRPRTVDPETRRPRAWPARFRRQRLLIVGCGDVGARVVRQAVPRRGVQLLALSSQPQRLAALRTQGLAVLSGNLDQPHSLRRLAGWAHRVLHLAPPGADAGALDLRTRTLVQALRRGRQPLQLAYGSTSGVYGNRHGALLRETDVVAPATDRARRRVHAEQTLRRWGRQGLGQPAISILRIPGIYAPDRPQGTPRERLLRGTPALQPQDDSYSNHIHADDLARACWLALWRGRPQRIVHVNDDARLKMGDYFDLAADLYGLPRPPRISLAAAREQLSPMLLSFMQESRQLDNRRLKQELGLVLRYPTPEQGLLPRQPLQSASC